MDGLKKLAYEIADLLNRYEAAVDVCIYFNNKRLIHTSLRKDFGWKLEKGFNPLDYTEYANKDTLTMTFEGALYEIINGYRDDLGFYDCFMNLLEKYGYYYEMGNYWNLTLYPL